MPTRMAAVPTPFHHEFIFSAASDRAVSHRPGVTGQLSGRPWTSPPEPSHGVGEQFEARCNMSGDEEVDQRWLADEELLAAIGRALRSQPRTILVRLPIAFAEQAR